MQLIDTHSHLDTHHFTEDFHKVLQRARQAGVIAQILPGVYRDWWPNLLKIAGEHHDLFAAAGLHPMYMRRHRPEHVETLNSIAAAGKLIGVGEIGLDYFIKHVDHHQQKQLFEEQLKIAKNFNLPVLLHVRKAHDQVQSILRRVDFSCGGIVHAFNGSHQQANGYLRLGFKIGFGGTLTYSRSTRIRSAAQALPLGAIVLETDAPDIPPAQHHGKRNSPEYLPLILEALALLRAESLEEIAAQTTTNAKDILQLEKHMPHKQ